MCGRYTLTRADKLADRYLLERLNVELVNRFNIAPTQPVPVILNESRTELTEARWGLIPSFATDAKIGNSLINARAETVATKPAYRSAFQSRRCFMPADGFYEWEKTGLGRVPHRFSLANEEIFSFAGLWERWKSPGGEWITSCALITTTPNELVAPIHDRMPVLLLRDRESAWLDPETPVEELHSFLAPYPPREMKRERASRRANSPANDDEQILQEDEETFRLS